MTFLSLPALGAVCALASAFTWAVTSLLVRTVSPPLTSVTVSAVRALLGGSLLLAWVLAAGGFGRLAAIGETNLLLLLVSIVVAIAVGDVMFFESARFLGLARAMTVSMIYPLLSAVFAAVFLGESLSVRVGGGSLVTLAGLALIVRARHGERVREERLGMGLAAALVAAVAWAVSLLVLKPAMGTLDPVTAQAVRLPLASVVLFATPWGWSAPRQVMGADRATLGRVVLLGVITAASSVLFVTSVKWADVAVAAVLSSTAPLFALPLGLLFLGERVTRLALLGTALAVTGVALLQV
ncbi:MAG TPA: DMT family transporter [Candidatus Bathyarchaeia archaeon]|nr:DMT family transporter [Candidatus Bathyarchaeia archaeon]